jgi:hypothetical protein
MPYAFGSTHTTRALHTIGTNVLHGVCISVVCTPRDHEMVPAQHTAVADE